MKFSLHSCSFFQISELLTSLFTFQFSDFSDFFSPKSRGYGLFLIKWEKTIAICIHTIQNRQLLLQSEHTEGGEGGGREYWRLDHSQMEKFPQQTSLRSTEPGVQVKIAIPSWPPPSPAPNWTLHRP
jgi:hypothetical protein